MDGAESAEIEAAVRRYLARIGRRYMPLLVGLAVLAGVVAFVPTVNSSNSRRFGSDGGGSLTAGGSTGGSSAPGGENQSGPGTGNNGGGLASGSSASGTGLTGGQAGAPLAPPGVGAGITPAAPVGAVGTTRSGISCGPGIRQVTFTVYSPLCVPAYTGNNGGATSHGVTADSINVAYRLGNSTEDAAVFAAAGAAAPAPDPVFVQDMNTYIDFFNKNYELYGRKVKLFTFQGQGDYISEDQGQGQPQAQADAKTEYDRNAFADATFFLKQSEVFNNSVTAEHIVDYGPLSLPQKWFAAHAPYAYAWETDGTKVANWMANQSCARMAGMPAVYAGDPLYQHTNRRFGIITPENPDYVEVGNEIQAGLKACGVTPARRATYQINVAAFAEEGASIAAQLKAAGVTTVLCDCDPLIPIFLAQAAARQQYNPEWVAPTFQDPQGRLMDQGEWAHAMSQGMTTPPRNQIEAYRVFKLASPNAEPAEMYYYVAYETVLHLFDTLQAAGPDLNPRTLQQGTFSLPKMGPGDFNTWGFGPGAYTPPIDTQLAWWNPNAISNADGKQGAWITCEGGARFLFADPKAWGPPHTQLHCFGH